MVWVVTCAASSGEIRLNQREDQRVCCRKRECVLPAFSSTNTCFLLRYGSNKFESQALVQTTAQYLMFQRCDIAPKGSGLLVKERMQIPVVLWFIHWQTVFLNYWLIKQIEIVLISSPLTMCEYFTMKTLQAMRLGFGYKQWQALVWWLNTHVYIITSII